MYEKGNFSPLSVDDFINRTISFLENLSPEIILQRLIGRAPKDRTLYCNGGKSWWKIVEQIEQKMKDDETYQGKMYKIQNTKF